MEEQKSLDMTHQLTENLTRIKTSLPKEVTLVAVSKTKPVSSIEAVYQAGQRIFGENRVEELVEKYQLLPKDIEWHMIGHLQSKKVKKIAPFISLIHSVDSFKLLQEINKHAKNNRRIINCLLQFHIAQEETKYGLTLEQALTFINTNEFKQLENISIVGVMGMATFSSDEQLVREEFKKLKNISKEINKTLANAKIISMGMSNDYLAAIQEGSTMIRVGSSIFGSRN